MRDLRTRLEDKLKSVGAFMQAESGEAMKDQATPVVLWTEITADSAKLQSEQMTAQGEAFKKVQTSIPAKGEEQDVPDDMWIEETWDSLTTGSTDAEDAKAHNEKLRQDAVQAFSTYQDSTQSNVSGSAQFEAPPAVAQPDGGVSSNPGPSVGGAGSPSPSSTSSAWAGGTGGTGSTAGPAGGGNGPTLGNYQGNTTGTAWANTPGGGGTNQNPGGAGRVPGGPGTPGMPGGGLGVSGPGTGAGAGRGGAGGAGGGRGGAGAGAGGRGGVGAGGRAGAGGPGMGAGGRSGMGGLGGASGAGGAGAGGAGGRGGAGAGAGAGARGRGQEGEDDLEHETPDYLVGDQGVFDEDLPRVAPPVFGDWDNQR
ncbi:hypothetical protein [Saccharopolyspora dendranthemae]|nr:hypothetical protein [Saccharopolyspora dendranthemae]